MGRGTFVVITCIALFIVLLSCSLCVADSNLQALARDGFTPEVETLGKVERSLERATGRDWFGITQAVSNYIASYTSTAATWLKWPYFGVSTGVATIMVFFVIVYILIIVSGAVVVNGRDAPGRKLDAPPGQREQLTRAIMKAIDHAAAEFAENESLDNNAAGLGSQPNHAGIGAARPLKALRARRDVNKGRQNINAYVSSAVYNVLTWLSKPFMGYIVVLTVIILYMVVIIQIAMTSNVFPLASLGRALSASRFGDGHDDLAQTAHLVMKAINQWQERDLRDARNTD